MTAKYLLVVMSCIALHIYNVDSKINCDNETIAQTQLESYYKWWYRLYYFFFFFLRETEDVCLLADRYRKRLCADVVHACHSKLKSIDVDIIRDEIKEVGVCYKQKFQIKTEGEEPWKAKKRMFRCEAFKAAGEEVKRFYVSNGGKPGAVLIFNHEEAETAEAKKYVKVARLVTGLTLDPWNDKKNDKNKDEEQ